MLPNGLVPASFQTILTVPAGSLTAIRGKSLPGKRLYPETNAKSIDVTETEVLGKGHVVVAAGGPLPKHAEAMYFSTLSVGVELHGGPVSAFVAQLNSYAT